ncbi:MAG: hypothetical protein IKO20_04030 [Bacteroidaceae bacterium]|nr:hypothetical protein [Bacteroidaceae bacterium]
MISTISLKTDLGEEIIINDDFSDIANLMESVTTLLFATEYTLREIKTGYEAELQRVKYEIQCTVNEEQQTTEKNE